MTLPAAAETRVVLNSTATIHATGDCPVPPELFEVRGEITLEATDDGKYQGVGMLTHVRHELAPSFACDEATCNLVSQQEEDGYFYAEVTFACDGQPTLLVTPFYLPPIVSSGWRYSCPYMTEPLSPAWASIFSNFHETELSETELGQPGFSMTGFTIFPPDSTPYARKTYSFSDEEFSETTTVEIFHEPPEILSIEAQWEKTFLQGISKSNVFTATIDWNETGGSREVIFTLNGTDYPVANPGAAEVTEETKTFDVGTQYILGENPISVRAKLNEECTATQEFEPPHRQIVVPPWATPANLVARDGVLYDGQLAWPSDLEEVTTIEDIPLISGSWGFVGGAPEVGVKALSTEAPTPGDVSGDIRLGLGPIPIVTRSFDGTTTGTIGDSLRLTGQMTFELGRVSASRTVSLLDLIADVGTGCDGIPLLGEACAALRGLGRLTGEVSATANLTGDFADNGSELRFTGGSARIGIGAHVFIGGALPAPIDVAGFSVSGGGSGCVDFSVAPAIQYVSSGARLDFMARAYVPGFSVEYADDWPFGSGCGSQAPALDTELGASDAAVSIANDGRPRLALGQNGRMVVAWSEPPSGSARPSSEIFVSLYDGGAWGDAIRLTNDALLDQRPAVAFDAYGGVLVVWERNASPQFPAEASGIPAFAAGMELEYAALDADTGDVASRGSITTNSAFDFGPALCTTPSGTTLVWQRTPGTTLVGTPSESASIRQLVWNFDAFARVEVDVSGPTSGLFGWELACHPVGGAMIALARDMDGDAETETDREIFLYRKRVDAFGGAERLTNDEVADHAVHATFSPSGEPVVSWLRDEAIVGATGEPLGDPRTWVPASAAVGPAFVRGRVAVSSDTVLVAWPSASDVEYASAAYPPVATFAPPRAVASPTDIDTDVELARTASGEFALGVLRTPVVEGMPPALAARGSFSVSPFVPGGSGGTGGASGAGGDDSGTGGDRGGEGPDSGGAGDGSGGTARGGSGTATGGRGGSAGSDPTAGEGATGEAGEGGSTTNKESKPKDDGGCGCRTSAPRHGSFVPLIALAMALLRRRSRRRPA